MKIALVMCGITRRGWNSWAFGGDEESYVPPGLAILTAVCKKAGHEVVPLDMRKMRGWEDFCVKFQEADCQAYGFSCMSTDYEVASAAAWLIRRTRPEAILIIGGIHATVCTKGVQADSVWDYIIIGDGEEALPNLLCDMDNGGLTGGDSTEPCVIHGAHLDIDSDPLPDREAWDYRGGEMLNSFAHMFSTPFVAVTGGRGCPYRCAFCASANNRPGGSKVRFHSHDHIFAELNHLREQYAFRSLYFWDDLFIVTPVKSIMFAERYIREGFSADIICQARTDLAAKHPEAIEALAGAGLKMAVVGFESGSQRILDFVQKDTTVLEQIEAVKVFRKNRILVMANMMFGFPTETKEEATETANLVKWMRPAIFSPAFYTPYPGTILYEYCREHDLLLPPHPGMFRREANGPKIKGVDYDFLGNLITSICAGLSAIKREPVCHA